MIPFKPLNKTQIRNGSLINFDYLYYKNDPHPVVLITAVYPNKVYGVNLNYLTYPYIKKLIRMSCGKIGFTYQSIKYDRFIEHAFRSYKPTGIKNIKIMDCEIVNRVLQKVRSIDPNEIELIEREIRSQIEAGQQQMGSGDSPLPI